MREIKFRAWSGDTKEMIPYSEMMVEWFDYHESEDDFTMLEYTGLKDVNGKEIYEGDIITVEYGKGAVVFNAGCFMIEWISDPEANMEWLGMYHKPHQLGRRREDVEIIGNIYENPELLNSNSTDERSVATDAK